MSKAGQDHDGGTHRDSWSKTSYLLYPPILMFSLICSYVGHMYSGCVMFSKYWFTTDHCYPWFKQSFCLLLSLGRAKLWILYFELVTLFSACWLVVYFCIHHRLLKKVILMNVEKWMHQFTQRYELRRQFMTVRLSKW